MSFITYYACTATNRLEHSLDQKSADEHNIFYKLFATVMKS